MLNIYYTSSFLCNNVVVGGKLFLELGRVKWWNKEGKIVFIITKLKKRVHSYDERLTIKFLTTPHQLHTIAAYYITAVKNDLEF